MVNLAMTLISKNNTMANSTRFQKPHLQSKGAHQQLLLEAEGSVTTQDRPMTLEEVPIQLWEGSNKVEAHIHPRLVQTTGSQDHSRGILGHLMAQAQHRPLMQELQAMVNNLLWVGISLPIQATPHTELLLRNLGWVESHKGWAI